MDPEHDISFFEIHKRWSNFIKFFGTIIDTLSPATYHVLSKQPAKKAWHYFFQLLFFSFIVMLLIGIPYFIALPHKFQQETTKLMNITVTPNVDVDKTISFWSGNVVLTNEKEYAGETILITKDSAYFKKTPCLISNAGCLFIDEPIVITGEKMKKLFDNKQELSKVLFTVFIIMLPSILVGLYLFFLIKYSALVVILAVVGYSICMIFARHIKWKEVLVTSIYASTLVILPTVTLGFYINLYYIPLIVYLMMFTMALLLVGRKYHTIWE